MGLASFHFEQQGARQPASCGRRPGAREVGVLPDGQSGRADGAGRGRTQDMTACDPWQRASIATTPYARLKEENSRLLREDWREKRE